MGFRVYLNHMVSDWKLNFVVMRERSASTQSVILGKCVGNYNMIMFLLQCSQRFKGQHAAGLQWDKLVPVHSAALSSSDKFRLR